MVGDNVLFLKCHSTGTGFFMGKGIDSVSLLFFILKMFVGWQKSMNYNNSPFLLPAIKKFISDNILSGFISGITISFLVYYYF